MANNKKNKSRKSYDPKGKKRTYDNDGTKRKDEYIEDTSSRAGYNDVSWYVPNDQVLRDSASFAFSNYLGDSVQIGGEGGNKAYYGNVRTPGIMSMLWVPAYGVGNTTTEPINVAARNIYSFVRHANSGHSNYDAPDLMMYICAMDNMYTFFFECCRVYGTLRYYRYKNRYLAKTLVESMGFDYESLIQDLAGFRYFINTMALKLNVYAVPKSLTLFQRHAMMTSYVYADSESDKAQLYVFVPAGVGYLDEMNPDTGAWGKIMYKLKYDPLDETSNLNTYVGVKGCADQFNLMFNALSTSEDFNIMSGDILKAYGAENCVQLPTIGEDFTTVPVYQPEVLPQIMNARAFGTPFITDTGVPTDNHVCILNQDVESGTLDSCNAVLNNVGLPNMYHGDKFVFNLHEDAPTPEQVMVASRLTTGIGVVNSGSVGNMIALTTYGTEIPCRFTIYTRPMKYGPELTGTYSFNFYSYVIDGPSQSDVTVGDIWDELNSYIEQFRFISNFDWAPLVTYFTRESHLAEDIRAKHVFGDLDNFTVMESEDLKKMHKIGRAHV